LTFQSNWNLSNEPDRVVAGSVTPGTAQILQTDRLLEFYCHSVHESHINNDPVKPLLLGRGDLLLLARVGSWLVAYA
jgi:hypothetical protein